MTNKRAPPTAAKTRGLAASKQKKPHKEALMGSDRKSSMRISQVRIDGPLIALLVPLEQESHSHHKV
jgi:hypothetical protein